MEKVLLVPISKFIKSSTISKDIVESLGFFHDNNFLLKMKTIKPVYTNLRCIQSFSREMKSKMDFTVNYYQWKKKKRTLLLVLVVISSRLQ